MLTQFWWKCNIVSIRTWALSFMYCFVYEVFVSLCHAILSLSNRIVHFYCSWKRCYSSAKANQSVHWVSMSLWVSSSTCYILISLLIVLTFKSQVSIGKHRQDANGVINNFLYACRHISDRDEIEKMKLGLEHALITYLSINIST